jgi:hypothetical protein
MHEMNTFATLIRREWMQHRFGWALLLLLPLALTLLALGFGAIDLNDDQREMPLQRLPTMLTMIALAGGVMGTFLILGGTSLFLMSGLARRDHADRSVEFWLSMPTSHTASLGAPLLTHLLLVPAAALALGLVIGLLVSALLVGRVMGLDAWLGLPWGSLLAGAGALLLRMWAGLPLALLWLSPLLLAVVLANAWLKRWGLPALVVAMVLASLALDRLLGEGSAALLASTLFQRAGQSLLAATPLNIGDGPDKVPLVLQMLPGWALQDLAAAWGALLQPMFLACVALGAALFAALVDWRRRGASSAV